MTPVRPSDTSAGFADAAQSWNQRFAEPGFKYGTEANAWLQSRAELWQPGARVLCVADGEGRNSVWLARRGLQVDAFDIAEVGVAKARALAAEQGVQANFQVADCDSFDWPDQAYDGVAAIFVQFAEPALRERLFANMAACLKPGGTLVLQGYALEQLGYGTGGPGRASHLYTPDLLRQAFADLEILTLQAYEAELAEGTGHCGRSALIGMVARRR